MEIRERIHLHIHRREADPTISAQTRSRMLFRCPGSALRSDCQAVCLIQQCLSLINHLLGLLLIDRLVIEGRGVQSDLHLPGE